MEQQHTGTSTHPPRRDSDAPYWLIIREGSTHSDAITIERRGGEAVLPVFSSREEARMFIGQNFMEGRWYVEPTGVGELLSVLYGPSTKIGQVALDPAREMLLERALALVSLSRKAFAASVLSGDRSRLEEWSRSPRGRKPGVTAPAYTHHAINTAGKARRR